MPVLNELQIFFNETPTGLWLRTLFAALVLTFVLRRLICFAAKRIKRVTDRTSMVWDDAGVDLLFELRSSVIFAWSFYAFANALAESQAVEKPLLILFVASTVFQIGIWGTNLIRRWRQDVLVRRVKNDPSAASAMGLMYATFQALFLIFIVLIGLSNVGVDIGALVAGLGVGGIAVALAAQNVLGDLLASLSIVLDKPFVVGDFIVVGADSGNVEQIGIKTTRVRTLSGEELIFSNKDLLESRVRNFKRMYQRRITQNFSVSFETTPDQLEKIPVWVKELIDGQEKFKFDRCSLAKFGSSSYDFEVIFIVTDTDFNLYMNTQQKFYIDLIRKFAAEKVRLAVPVQALAVTDEKTDQPDVPAGNSSQHAATSTQATRDAGAGISMTPQPT